MILTVTVSARYLVQLTHTLCLIPPLSLSLSFSFFICCSLLLFVKWCLQRKLLSHLRSTWEFSGCSCHVCVCVLSLCVCLRVAATNSHLTLTAFCRLLAPFRTPPFLGQICVAPLVCRHRRCCKWNLSVRVKCRCLGFWMPRPHTCPSSKQMQQQQSKCYNVRGMNCCIPCKTLEIAEILNKKCLWGFVGEFYMKLKRYRIE